MPAHSSGATAARFSFGDTFRPNASSTTMWSEYPPKVIVPSAYVLL